MSYRKACEELQLAWDTVSEHWSAEAKSKYFSQIYSSLMSEANGMYQRNDDLENYAQQCVQSERM